MGQALIGFLTPLTIAAAGTPQQFVDAADDATNVRMTQVTFTAGVGNTGVIYVQTDENATTLREPIYPGQAFVYRTTNGKDYFNPSQFWFDTETNGNTVSASWQKTLGPAL